MSLKKVLTLNVMAAAIVGCGGGDINIAPSTVDNSVVGGGGGGGTANYQCASYTYQGTTYEGSYDGTHCTYSKAFVDVGNPLLVDVTFPNLGGGVHIFEGSLFVGQNYTLDADLAAAGIDEGGDGPTLTIAAGATLAFRSSDDLMVINRGSQIRANGTASEPITITSQTDALLNTVGPEDVQEWGGLIINGFGVTNKCSYNGTYPALTLANECHVVAEGKAGAGQSNYGGVNNEDNSGVLRYVVVKHTGAEVAPDNELNGITFNAVGSGTTVENLQVYSVFDDGIEFFGGAVNVKNFVALYANDDSIDIDEGYRGTITNALVIQNRFNGNHCIESDGIGSYDSLTPAVRQDFVDRGLNSQPVIRNLTCIVSANETGTHDPGRGILIREGNIPVIENAIVTTAYSGDDLLGDAAANYCLFIEDDESELAAINDDLRITSSVIACQDLTRGDLNGNSTLAWLDANGNATYQSAEAGEDPASGPDLMILDGFYSIPVAQMAVGGATVPAPAGGAAILGAVSAADDWTAGWTYGLHPDNRAQALWFE